MLADDDVLLLLLRQPEQGLEALMAQYMGLVYAIVAGKLAAVSSREDIEEVAGDVFYEFYQNRHSLDLSRGSLRACLAVMAKRRAIDRWRQLARAAAQHLPLTEAAQQPDQTETPEQAATAHEQRQRLLREIAALGWPDSEIFVRKYYLGQSSKTIAAALSLRVNTVDKKVSRGLGKLKQALGGER